VQETVECAHGGHLPRPVTQPGQQRCPLQRPDAGRDRRFAEDHLQAQTAKQHHRVNGRAAPGRIGGGGQGRPEGIEVGRGTLGERGLPGGGVTPGGVPRRGRGWELLPIDGRTAVLSEHGITSCHSGSGHEDQSPDGWGAIAFVICPLLSPWPGQGTGAHREGGIGGWRRRAPHGSGMNGLVLLLDANAELYGRRRGRCSRHPYDECQPKDQRRYKKTRFSLPRQALRAPMVVSGGGLEPPRVAPYAPQTYASASSAIPTKMVPKVGLEPTRAVAHGALNTACLPVPPLRQAPFSITGNATKRNWPTSSHDPHITGAS
jgi:hypothetical protein